MFWRATRMRRDRAAPDPEDAVQKMCRQPNVLERAGFFAGRIAIQVASEKDEQYRSR
jgi:hypothetical protein